MNTFERAVEVGTHVQITLDHPRFSGSTGIIIEAYPYRGEIEYTVTFADGRTDYFKRNQFVEPEYLPGGDAGCFPAAHPRPVLDTELKAGDKVRITLKNHAFDGETGTISRVPNLPFNEYTVMFERFGAGYYKRSEFEMVEPAETLGVEYEQWSDSLVNPGWTADETIAALRKELQQLHTIVGDLKDRLGKANREIVFLRHRPAAQR